MNHARTVVLMLAVSASSAGYCAAAVDECPAENYKQCSTFNTSRTIDEHTPIIDAVGYTRSRGGWTIHVGYGPSAVCAKVSLALDMGPLDIHRTYERVFHNGSGVISDTGSFVHQVDNVESGLRILTSTCRVPDSGSKRLEGDGQEQLEWETERERLEWEAERERLALEAEAQERRELEAERERLATAAERERQALEAERQRLAMEAERKRLEEERRRAQAQRAREQELERERLAARQRILREVEQRVRLARQERERMEEERRREREKQESATPGSALDVIVTGFGVGALVGSVITGDDQAFDAASRLLSRSTGGMYVPSGSDSSGGSGCEQIGERLSRNLESLSRSNSGMCAIYTGTARAYRQARNELAATGCATSQELVGFDRAISQAEAGASAAC